MDDPQGLAPKRTFKPRVFKLRSWLGFTLTCAALLLQGCAANPLNSGVYVVETIDGAPRWLGGPAGEPVWAPTENALAWATEDGIFRQDLMSEEPTLLSAQAGAGRLSWSPDGRTIAFVDREEEALVALDARSGAPRFSVRIATKDAGHGPLALPVIGGPAWSPDGSRLVFNCWDGHGDEICVVQADGSGHRQITNIESRKSPIGVLPGALVLAESNTGPAVWSPDGTALAVAAYPEVRGAATGVFVVDLEGGSARRVSSLLPNSEIKWFPGGESLLFSASVEGRSDAVRASVAEGGTEKLTAGLAPGASDPAISPDGTRLAVSSGDAIVVLDLEGNVQGTTENGLLHRLPAWSPDGERIAFATAPKSLESYS
jgi:Tol biopolymer transport system component